MSELFLSNEESGVLRISFNRPKLHNAFNDELISSLTTFISSKASDPSIRLMILCGEGKSFSAGADLNWMKKMVDYSEEENLQDSIKLANLFETINSFPSPVIGKIHGAALGGGAGLVAVCDYVIATKSCKFGFTETRLGLLPAVISPYVIAKIGESKARAHFSSGSRFTALEAFQMNLVHQLVDEAQIDLAVTEKVNEFLMAAPKAAREAKDLIKKVLAHKEGPEQLKLLTCNIISKKRISSEGQEGMNALLNKVKASWISE